MGATEERTLLPPRNLFFTGRDNDLQTLHSLLSRAGDKGIVYAVSGLGGIGKTALAVEYAYRYGDDYAFRFFVNASSPTTLTDAYRRLAALVGSELPADASADLVVQTAKSWLDLNTSYLLIVDNADFTDDYTPEHLQAFLPDNPKGHLLVTSRAQVFSAQLNILPGAVRLLGTLDAMESVALLVNRIYGADKVLPDAEQHAARELAERLGGLPLALEQAAAYVAAQQTNLRAYLTLYDKQHLKQLEKAKPQTGNYPQTIAATWRLNFEEIAASEPAAADLLTLCAFLAPENIPAEIVIGAAREALPSVQEFMGDLEDADVNEAQYHELLEPLTRYSLVQKDPQGLNLSCHRMVQAVLRESLSAEEQHDWIERAVNSLFAIVPLIRFETWGSAARLMPHIQAVILQCQAVPYESEEAAWLCNQMALFLAALGLYSDAEQMYLAALEMRRNVLAVNHPMLVQSLNNLAELYRSQGRYSEAEPLYLQILEIYKTELYTTLDIGDSALIALTSNNLGLLYAYQGRYTEAEPLYQNALRIFEALSEDNAANIAQCRSNLGLLYDSQGRYAEAETLFNDVLNLRLTFQPVLHPDIALSLNNLATVYYHQARYAEAEEVYSKAVTICNQTLPENHPTLVMCVSNLAEVYREEQRFEEAEPLFTKVLEVYRATLPAHHPNIASTLNNLAMLYHKQERYDEAETLLTEALEILSVTLPADHPDFAIYLSNLASVRDGQGREDEAEALFVKALAVTQAKLGDAHAMTQILEINLQELREKRA